MNEQSVSTDGAGGHGKGRKGVLIGAAVIAGIVVIVLVILLAATHAVVKSEVILNLAELLGEENIGMDLEISVDIDDQEINLQAGVRSAGTEGGATIYQITYKGLSLYYTEGALFLENGTAYRLLSEEEDDDAGAADSESSSGSAAGDGDEAEEESGETVQDPDSYTFVLDYSTILSLLTTYYADTAASVGQEDGVMIYTIQLDGETSGELLEILYLPAAERIHDMTLTVDLYVENDLATDIMISGAAAVGATGEQTGDETELSVIAHIIILTGEDGTFVVPDAVLSAIDSGDAREAPVLTDGLFRLLTAWNHLGSRDNIGADISIGADFGLFTLDLDMNWVRTTTGDEPVNCLTFRGNTYYVTDDGSLYGVVLADGTGIVIDGEDGDTGNEEPEDGDGAEDADPASSGNGTAGESGAEETGTSEDEELASDMNIVFFLETAYELFSNGSISISVENGSSVYTVSLTQEEMEALVSALIPDAANLDITYKDAQFTAVVEEEEFVSLSLSGGGSVTILFAEVSIDLEIDITMMEAAALEGFSLPQAAA